MQRDKESNECARRPLPRLPGARLTDPRGVDGAGNSGPEGRARLRLDFSRLWGKRAVVGRDGVSGCSPPSRIFYPRPADLYTHVRQCGGYFLEIRELRMDIYILRSSEQMGRRCGAKGLSKKVCCRSRSV